MNGFEHEHVFEQKDLGVIIDSKLKFDEHISKIVDKAIILVGLIRSSFTFLDGPLLRKLFTTFVWPHPEYAQTAWSPFLYKHIDLIEDVQ